MKKIISLAMIFVLLAASLIGCRGEKGNGDSTSNPHGTNGIGELNGTDVIKLLLASERLDSQLLKNGNGIFDSGSEAMRTLASRAKANLPKALATSGNLEVNGTTYKWSDFEENCNSYDYFESITQNIIASAERGADMIDKTKKHVRIVDKWVRVTEDLFYLHVDAGSETIYLVRGDQIDICRRHKNDNGKNVYELYTSNGIAEQRMYYIPGERYEWSERFKDDSGSTYFVADNSKGFWETLIVGEAPAHYNVSCFVMKDDICYEAIYDATLQQTLLLKSVSSDRACDLMFFTENGDTARVSLHLGAFSGINSVELTVNADEISYEIDNYPPNTSIVHCKDSEESYATTTGTKSPFINLENGGRIVEGGEYANGNVIIGRVLVSYGGGTYKGELELTLFGANDAEKTANLDTFLREAGLTCKYDISTVLGGIRRAYVEVDGFVDYYLWNSYSIATNDGIAAAIDIENEKFVPFDEMYGAIKNAPIIDINDSEALELNASFSPITAHSQTGALLEGDKITFSSIELTADDTLLMVEGEPYTVAFALSPVSGGGLIHLSTSLTESTVFSGGEAFTVAISGAAASLPVLSEGSYVPVAYIATGDMIRSSRYVPVTFTGPSDESTDLGDMSLTSAQSTDGSIILTYTKNIDISVYSEAIEALGYEDLRSRIAQIAYEYGIPSNDPLEVYDPSSDSFIELSPDIPEHGVGIYRLEYSIENADAVQSGYVYFHYTEPTYDPET